MPFFRAPLLLLALALVSPFVCSAPGNFPPDAVAISSSSSHSDPSFAEKITIPGMRGVAKVNDFLFRGAQPERTS